MYAVEIDGPKRLMVISAVGRVTKEEVKMAAQRVRETVEGAAPGFRVLTDFRWLDSMEPASAYHIAEIMDTLVAKEVGSVVRVIPDPHKDIGLNILSHFHYGPNVPVATFESLAEALQALVGGPTTQNSALQDQKAKEK
jgi:hypothetical protein